MAKFLAYNRTTARVVTVESADPAVVNVGSNTIALADTTSAFPNRCENLIASFRGDYYFLYRSAANEIRLSVYDGTAGTWGDHAPFTTITTGAGVLTPVALHVVKDRLVAVATLFNSVGVDSVMARRCASNSAASWDATITLPFVAQPLDSRGGPSTVWRNAVWISTSEGVVYYDSDNNTLAPAFDPGDDLAIVGQKANFGSFATWQSDLYYVLPTDLPAGAPSLYKLDKTWSVGTPTPTFIKQSAVIPAVGGVTLANDGGNYSLFVNKVGELCLIYSGTLQTKLVKIAVSGASYTVTDLSAVMLSTTLQSAVSLGFSYYVDDRRSSSEQHTVIIRYMTAVPVAVVIASWDGATALSTLGTLDGGGAGLDLMVPDVERSDFRTFTDNQPSCAIETTSAPFPGRTRIDYLLRDSGSRTMDIAAEYSLDGQTWSTMAKGDGDDGIVSLTSSPTGVSHFFHWDAYQNLEGNIASVDIRVVARISGV